MPGDLAGVNDSGAGRQEPLQSFRANPATARPMPAITRRTDPMTAERYLRVLANPAPRATVPAPISTKPVIMIHAYCASMAASALMSSRWKLYSSDKPADEPGGRERDRTGQSKSTQPHAAGWPHP